MCGIVGLIDHAAGHVPPGLLAAMRDSMAVRGPDGEGHFIEGPVGMAMRRLAVIDLEGGAQPLASRNGSVLAFQNGEIYNYRELRSLLEGRGHRFQTRSDTEVLAHGFTEWGMDGLLDRVDGMYAIALLDRGRRELHLARDRFGEKPLFYLEAPGRFAYSSTLLALAALPWADDSLNPLSLRRYLGLHFVPGDSTILRRARRVLPGERLVVPLDDPRPRRTRYYRPPLGDAEGRAERDPAELVEHAIESRMVADVPVGIFLSGGLDSSLVASVAARRHSRVATFSMGFASGVHDESAHAKLVARTIGSDHHHFTFDESSFLTLLPQVAAALDEPIGDQALLPLYWLCREARKHVTVVLAGEGADEVFAGYGYYRPFFRPSNRIFALLSGRFRPTPNAPAVGRLIENAQPVSPSGFPLLTDVGDRDRLAPGAPGDGDAWEEDLLAWLAGASDPLQRATATDLTTWLPDDLLVKSDRMTMAHGLEGRAPYLQPDVVAYGLRLPPSRKVSSSSNKLALRALARRWLPKAIHRRPKQGFVLPMKQWLVQWFAKHGGPHGYVRERPVPFLDTAAVAALIESDLERGVARERLLFALVSLVEWYHSFSIRTDELRAGYAREAVATPLLRTTDKGQDSR